MTYSFCFISVVSVPFRLMCDDQIRYVIDKVLLMSSPLDYRFIYLLAEDLGLNF